MLMYWNNLSKYQKTCIFTEGVEKMKPAVSDDQIPYKIYLAENELPQAWYNVRADM